LSGHAAEESNMAVTKAKKIEQATKLSSDLKNVKSAIVGTFNKMTVAQDYELRKSVRSAGGKYRVVKNTLAERAAAGTQIADAIKDLKGVTSIAYTEGDPVALAKVLAKYAKDNPEFSFKAGVVEGRVISIKEISALATMPSKEEIYSKLLFLISAPAQRLVTVMNAVGRDVAVVLNQGVQQKKFKEAEAAS
jgi:large subunit ribosomal protein L10